MTRWAMVIDLTRCIGCKACILACSQANAVPEGLWRKLDQLEEPQTPLRQRLFATRSCMHCSNPSCKSVCPTTATYQRPDGIVEIDYEKCVGCGYCVVACPYDARIIFRYHHDFEANAQIGQRSDAKACNDCEGVCTKCNFCITRVEEGLKKNLTPGVDSDATPFCVVNCSCDALSFGDLDDPKSSVSKTIRKRQTLRLLTELETDPSVYYIIK